MRRKSSLWLLILIMVTGSFSALGGQQRVAQAAPVNLALGKTVTMSKPASWGQVAAHMTDGDDNTLSQVESNDPWSLTIDLGALYVVDRVVMKPHPSAYPTVFIVQTSKDETAWHTAAQENAGVEAGKTYDFAPVKARYVHIEVSAISNPNQAIKEVEVYGVAVDTFAPEEVTQLATVPGNEMLSLQWMDPPDADFKEVRIYDQDESLIETIAKGERNANITGLTNGVEYALTVKSVDQSGNESAGIVTREVPKSIALDLQSIRINGTALPGYDPVVLDYDFEVAEDAAMIPRIQASSASANDSITIVQADSVPGMGKIRITGGGGTKTYNVRFYYGESVPAADARLSEITVAGVPLAVFQPEKGRYLIKAPSQSQPFPVVGATAAAAGAVVTVTQAAQLPGTASIHVTAADETTTATYTVQFAAEAAKQTLLFEIDEGIGENELVSLYKNDFNQLDAALGNIYGSLNELSDQYDVAVLLYPTHHYKREGWGSGNAQPLDRIDAALKHTLQYFEDRGGLIKVYLEIYSSGIATNQNGALASLPPPPLYASLNGPGRIGLSMDVDTLKGLKDAYPQAMAGIRLHEAYGSDLVWRVNKGQGGFQFDEELVRAFIDASAEKGLKVDWSDSSWLVKFPADSSSKRYVYDPQNKPYFETAPYSSLQDYAEQKLGDHMIFNWANNNYHPTAMLGYWDAKIGEDFYDYLQWKQPFTEFPFKNRTAAKWGMSVQNWFWHEMNNSLNQKYYLFGENNMPVELMGAYALKGLAEGAAIIQFEPPWYFFNMNIPYAAPYRGNYEQAADYSERLAMKRLKQMLLDPGSAGNPPTDLKAWFDEDQEKFIANKVDNAPLNYWQSTLAAGWSDQQRTYLDKYTGMSSWQENNANRYHPYLFSGNVLDSLRIDLHGDGIDELLLLKQNGGTKSMEFYSVNSGLLGTGSSIALDNADGQFVGIATANLIAEVNKQGDPDEIIVFRSRAGDSALNARIYSVKWSDSLLQFQLEAVPYGQSAALLDGQLAPGMLEASSFVKAVGIRTESYKLTDQTRNTDRLVVVTSKNSKLFLNIKSDRSVVSTELSGLSNAAKLRIAPIDADTDRRDELIVVNQEGDAPVIQTYKLDESLLSIRMAASMNTTPYYNQHVASKAIDGDLGTYAQSSSNVPWDLTVDLGTIVPVDQVRYVPAQGNHASHYTIDVSVNNSDWTTVATVTDGDGSPATIDFPSVNARYVKLNVDTVVGGGADYGHAILEFSFPGLKPFVQKESIVADRGSNKTIDYVVGLRKALLVNADPLSAGNFTYVNAAGQAVSALQPGVALTAQVQLTNRKPQAQAVTVSAILYNAAGVEQNNSQQSAIVDGNAVKTVQTKLKLPQNVEGFYLKLKVLDSQETTLSSATLRATATSGGGNTGEGNPGGGTGGGGVISANPQNNGFEKSQETQNGRTIQIYTVKPSNGQQGKELLIDATGSNGIVKVRVPAATIITGEGDKTDLVVKEQGHTYRLPLAELDLSAATTAFGTEANAYELEVSVEQNLIGLTVSITAHVGGKSVNIPFKKKSAVMLLELNEKMTGVPVLLLPDGAYGYVRSTNVDGKTALMIRGSGTYGFVESGRKINDIAGSWAKKEIAFLASSRIIDVGDEGKLSPQSPLGRAELMVLLLKSFSPETVSASDGQGSFSDLDESDGRARYVYSALMLGWTQGVSAGVINPDGKVTREQMAVLISRVLKDYGFEASASSPNKTWSDSSNISGWADGDVQLAAQSGLMNGRANGKFSPGDAVTRAEAAVIIYRMLNFVQQLNQ
ncbi:discoidin domain-containing protein [Cohnella silvisoli]|uniref:Discoidin domain-containing protein n=1 Tax=Cohnella silvisoli TaxID=2873699 RepID=A0ABV1L1X2_9BACL|nr:discoidin domain-containing protein [Cohnella silvisoli]MCD9025705.1 discoidin domain-containing protein [Cohnella silvisoli]